MEQLQLSDYIRVMNIKKSKLCDYTNIRATNMSNLKSPDEQPHSLITSLQWTTWTVLTNNINCLIINGTYKNTPHRMITMLCDSHGIYDKGTNAHIDAWNFLIKTLLHFD